MGDPVPVHWMYKSYSPTLTLALRSAILSCGAVGCDVGVWEEITDLLVGGRIADADVMVGWYAVQADRTIRENTSTVLKCRA